ncbi:hypothetical protein MHYP_G00148020, partial [Metynnis hypsauchen]
AQRLKTKSKRILGGRRRALLLVSPDWLASRAAHWLFSPTDVMDIHEPLENSMAMLELPADLCLYCAITHLTTVTITSPASPVFPQRYLLWNQSCEKQSEAWLVWLGEEPVLREAFKMAKETED